MSVRVLRPSNAFPRAPVIGRWSSLAVFLLFLPLPSFPFLSFPFLPSPSSSSLPLPCLIPTFNQPTNHPPNLSHISPTAAEVKSTKAFKQPINPHPSIACNDHQGLRTNYAPQRLWSLLPDRRCTDRRCMVSDARGLGIASCAMG